MTADEMNLIDAERALVWAADGGVWSARVTPTQSRSLIAELERLRKVETLRKEQHERERAPRASAIGAPPDFGRSSA